MRKIGSVTTRVSRLLPPPLPPPSPAPPVSRLPTFRLTIFERRVVPTLPQKEGCRPPRPCPSMSSNWKAKMSRGAIDVLGGRRNQLCYPVSNVAQSSP